jgi:monofunctional biosynthetic peptidoglycan transglycosylase
VYRKVFYHHQVKPVKFISLRKIPAEVKNMVIEIEDSTFYQHKGVDPEAIKESIELNKRYHRPVYGGSTITQQLARTLFLTPQKNFLRKYLEALIALEMDLFLKKERILELYLNSAEWGRGIFGIERASYFYYGKSVRDLELESQIRLITILSSPVKYNPENFYKLRLLQKRYEILKSEKEII